MTELLAVVCIIQAVALWALSVGQGSTYRSFLHAIKAENAAEFAMLEKTARPPKKAPKSPPPPTPYGL